MAKIELLFTIILCAAVVLFGGFLVANSAPVNFRMPFRPETTVRMIEGVSLVYISFFGFQVIATATEEIRTPRKTIPKAILYSSLIATWIYLLIAVGLVGLFGRVPDGNPALLLEMAANRVWGDAGSIAIIALGLVATFTSLNATVHAVALRTYAIARDRYVPEMLALVHSRFRTPHIAILSIAVIVGLLILSQSLTFVASLSSFAYLLSLIFVHYALILSRRHHRHASRGYRMPFVPFFPILGMVINVGVLAFLSSTVILFGIGWTVLGLVLFHILKRREAGLRKLRLWAKRIELLVRGKRIEF
jgi:amino acid transporter